MTTTPTLWGTEAPFSNYFGDYNPKVAALADNSFSIVWERDGTEIVGRHFNELGSFTGGDFLSTLSASTTKALTAPQVFQQVDGKVVVNYVEQYSAGDRDIHWHSVDEANPDANSYPTEYSTADEILLDSTARTGGGGANVFIYSSGGTSSLALRFTDSIGQQASNRIIVGAHANETQQNASVTGLHTGFVVVAYENYNFNTGVRDVRFHTYTPGEADVSGEVIVSTSTNAGFPDVIELKGGSFVVAWQQSDGIAFRQYIGNGTPVDAAPHVIPGSSGFLPKITALNDGGFIVAWTTVGGTESDGSPDLDIVLQRFDASGNAIGSLVHFDDPGDQGLFGMSITTLHDGRVVIAYGSETGDSTNVTTLNYRIVDPRDSTIYGSISADENIVAREDSTHIITGAGADKQTGRGGNDTLDSGDGADTLLGGGGNDSLLGGAGNDRLSGDDANDSLYGNVGNDNLDGGTGNDLLHGDAGGDSLLGAYGNDTLFGDAGNDTLRGGNGNDYIDGGDGIDTATYAQATSGVTVSLAITTAQNTGSASSGIDTLLHIENLIGSNYNDVLTGSTANNRIDAGAGNDSLSGGAGNDFLIGGTGNDTLSGGGGNDTLDGGAGNDVFRIDSTGDSVTDSGGVDRVESSVTHTLGGAIENLTLTGTAAINGTGNALNNRVVGNEATNVLSGLGGNDTLIGNGGNDSLIGGSGKDSLDGGAGADSLFGGAGNDILSGGAGSDKFIFTALSDSGPGAAHDTILAFDGVGAAAGDQIVLSAIDANSILGGDQAFHFIGAGAFTGVAGQLHTIASGTNTLIQGDVNGDKVADFEILVQDGAVLPNQWVAGDFIL